LVTRAIPQSGLSALQAHCEVDVYPEDRPAERSWLLAHAPGASALLSMVTDVVDAQLMDAAGPGLRVLSNLAVGLDNIDVAEATRRKLPVGHTPDVLTEATADLAFSLLLAVARRLPEAQAYVKEGKWKTWSPSLLLGKELAGSTLGIVGFGRIGRAVARRAHGFSMRVLAARRNSYQDMGDGTAAVPLSQLLAESDFVSIHCSLTPATRGLFDARAFEQMKPGAVLVNTSRGAVVDTDALLSALTRGGLAGAGLDVTDPEPLPASHPLLSLPQCLVAPHIGSATTHTRMRMAETAANNILAGIRGERLPYCANPSVYGAG
jgi:lactate dehydrogenase-like 2-hydroxyacid dehydrogenase